MRMWMVPPRLMCRKHLLGEHVELHMLVGSLRKKKSVNGFLSGRLIELHSIEKRHAALVMEMKRRGYTHKSPLRAPKLTGGRVDRKANLAELASRCADCRQAQASQRPNP